MSAPTTSEALAIVDEFKTEHRLRGTLEAMATMKAHDEIGSLTDRERAGFRVVFQGFRDLLEPIGGWQDA